MRAFLCVLLFAGGVGAIEAESARYLGVKYVLDPLGEGFGYDADPVRREDAFDCLTFVETAMADAGMKDLQCIRYRDCKIDFVGRNHFLEIDWIANNSDIVEDITASLGLPVRTVSTVVDRSAWLLDKHKIESACGAFPAEFDIIAVADIARLRIDEPVLALFAMGKIDGAIFSHIGFLIPGADQRIVLRHASSKAGRVLDEDLIAYVRRRGKEISGITVLRINN
ncbi:MAG: DUF1460 domain-containing protein [Alphaproteobacteria bacterium]|nr:DUF1460 domain-containing protein [Alphaproteobacteria bacterium]